MTRSRSTIVILICAIIMLTSQNILASEKPDITKGTISVTGTASEDYLPDMVKIILTIETTENTVSESSSKNNAISEKVMKSLKKIIDTSSGDRIKTSSYSVQPKYEYDKSKKRNELVGYMVSNQITVKTGTISNAGKIIDKAIETGVNRVHNINFIISDDNKYCDELLGRASKRGRHEAEIVANSLDVSIAGIKSVSSACSDFGKPPVYPRGFAQEVVASKSAASIEPGSIKLTATVNLVFFIDNSN